MKTLATLLALLTLSPLTASADPLFCGGYPNQEFNNRLGHEMEALINTIRCKNLNGALQVLRRMDSHIRVEIARNQNGNTAYGECYEDRNCQARISQGTPTKAMCKASGGQSWRRTNPLPRGSCEIVR